METVMAVVAALSIPSAITGFLFWKLERKITKNEEQRERQEQIREKSEILLVKSVGAAIALGEATAIAQKNGKCNGETEAALEYARSVKHEQKDFLYEQGIKGIY